MRNKDLSEASIIPFLDRKRESIKWSAHPSGNVWYMLPSTWIVQQKADGNFEGLNLWMDSCIEDCTTLEKAKSHIEQLWLQGKYPSE